MSDGPASERLRRLCAVLGHELRNPLAAALTSVGVAAALTDRGDPRAPHLQRASDDLERLAALLTTYLDWGRGCRPSRRPIELGAVAAAAARRHPGAVVTGGAVLPIAGDPDLLGRVLDNLLENAAAAGARRVELRLAVQGSEAVVEVADDGPGVRAELTDCLFEPFVSGRGSSGLGLAVARDVIEAHGGRIELRGREQRAGAVFRITLPLSQRAASVIQGAQRAVLDA
jgi:signal transduction histidine kinase